MSIEHLIAFNLAVLAAVVSPGPALLVAVRTTIVNGRAAGMAIGAGLALTASAWTLTALLGLDAVFRVFPWAYGIAKTLGAVYLIYLAIRTWRGSKAEIENKAGAAKHAFSDGILINLLNPKSVLFAAAVLIVVFPGAMTATENAIVWQKIKTRSPRWVSSVRWNS